MIDLLNWIVAHPGASFLLGIFTIIMWVVFFEGIESIVKASGRARRW